MPRTDVPFDPETSNFGPPRPLSLRFGVSRESLFGYYEPERSERFAADQATTFHQDYIVVWYQLLNEYYRALVVPRITSEDEVWVIEWKILRLGLVAAKGALDAALLATTFVRSGSSVR